jgi:hypothetical protein
MPRSQPHSLRLAHGARGEAVNPGELARLGSPGRPTLETEMPSAEIGELRAEGLTRRGACRARPKDVRPERQGEARGLARRFPGHSQ